MRRPSFAVGNALAAALLLAAGSGCRSGGNPPPPDPGTSVAPTPSASEQAERAQVAAALSAVANLDAAGLGMRFPTGFTTALGYDPLAATNLSLIQASPLALNDGERAVLATNGFVISDRQRFPGFSYGYGSIYAEDLPLFVSADSILNAVHRSTTTCSRISRRARCADACGRCCRGCAATWPRARSPRSVPRSRRTSTCTWRCRWAC